MHEQLLKGYCIKPKTSIMSEKCHKYHLLDPKQSVAQEQINAIIERKGPLQKKIGADLPTTTISPSSR